LRRTTCSPNFSFSRFRREISYLRPTSLLSPSVGVQLSARWVLIERA
jgi:hypothetical protein